MKKKETSETEPPKKRGRPRKNAVKLTAPKETKEKPKRKRAPSKKPSKVYGIKVNDNTIRTRISTNSNTPATDPRRLLQMLNKSETSTSSTSSSSTSSSASASTASSTSTHSNQMELEQIDDSSLTSTLASSTTSTPLTNGQNNFEQQIILSLNLSQDDIQNLNTEQDPKPYSEEWNDLPISKIDRTNMKEKTFDQYLAERKRVLEERIAQLQLNKDRELNNNSLNPKFPVGLNSSNLDFGKIDRNEESLEDMIKYREFELKFIKEMQSDIRTNQINRNMGLNLNNSENETDNKLNKMNGMNGMNQTNGMNNSIDNNHIPDNMRETYEYIEKNPNVFDRTERKFIVDQRLVYYYKSHTLFKEWSNGYPDQTDVWCWWCAHPFKNRPLGIPVKLKNNASTFDNWNDLEKERTVDESGGKVKEYYEAYGCFCSGGCALSYLEREGDGSKQLLQSLYYKITGIRSLIKKAPPQQALKSFGGPLSIEEFRNISNKKETVYNIVKAPIFPMHYWVEETTLQVRKVDDPNGGITCSSGQIKLKRTKPIKGGSGESQLLKFFGSKSK